MTRGQWRVDGPLVQACCAPSNTWLRGRRIAPATRLHRNNTRTKARGGGTRVGSEGRSLNLAQSEYHDAFRCLL